MGEMNSKEMQTNSNTSVTDCFVSSNGNHSYIYFKIQTHIVSEGCLSNWLDCRPFAVKRVAVFKQVALGWYRSQTQFRVCHWTSEYIIFMLDRSFWGHTVMWMSRFRWECHYKRECHLLKILAGLAYGVFICQLVQGLRVAILRIFRSSK